jgi:hypothetical protein
MNPGFSNFFAFKGAGLSLAVDVMRTYIPVLQKTVQRSGLTRRLHLEINELALAVVEILK